MIIECKKCKVRYCDDCNNCECVHLLATKPCKRCGRETEVLYEVVSFPVDYHFDYVAGSSTLNLILYCGSCVIKCIDIERSKINIYNGVQRKNK